MKLEKFKEKNQKRTKIIVFTILCILLVVGVFFYSSFALFEVKENFNILKGDVETPGDLSFVYYVDDVVTKNPPTMSSGYTLSSKSSCNNGVTVTWDNENWSALVNYTNYQKTNTSVVKCSLYFEKFSKIITECGKEKSGATCLLENKSKTNELVLDETIDNNLRYIGANPNNYVRFNNELWRIIGVMNNMKTNETDSGESRIKLVREKSIGNYSWDASETSINEGYGVNDWGAADLMKLLNEGYDLNKDLNSENSTILVNNSLYWNATLGTCYIGESNATSSCDFTKTGLKVEESKNMIENTLWNLGGAKNYMTIENGLITHWYTQERGDSVYEKRPTMWLGKIGLVYPSDYAFATSGGKDYNRKTCHEKTIYNWNEAEDCRRNSWLWNEFDFQWTLTTPSELKHDAFRIYPSGIIHTGYTFRNAMVSPVLYLKSNIKIISGEGTKEIPYELSM